MKVGGNGSATDFFTRHGGSSLLNDSDVKKKYSSRVAELYKEELVRRVKEDAIRCATLRSWSATYNLTMRAYPYRFPNGIVVDGVDTSKSAAAQPSTGADEEDFFSSWDKPAPKAKPASPPSKPAAPPSIGRTVSAPASASPPSAPVSAAPRTVTSSSLRSNTTSAASTARALTSSSTSSTGTGAGGARPAKKGLGAKKAAPVDFAEAERRAAAEAERVRQLGYDREREEAEAKAAREAAALDLKNKSAAATSPGAKLAGSTSGANSADVEKLGTGMKRLGFGGMPSAQPAAPKKCVDFPLLEIAGFDWRFCPSGIALPRYVAPVADDAPTTARDRFGNQKAISSDMYFERGSYDPASAAEGRVRLQQFQGATSISSNQYFGREEEEMAAEGSDGLLGDGSLAGLETAARDAVTRIMANPDVQNMGESLRSGALKVCDPCIMRHGNFRRTNSGCFVPQLSDYLAQMSER
jgi:ADP-ribosylation factor GTPase-activating protein 2/3